MNDDDKGMELVDVKSHFVPLQDSNPSKTSAGGGGDSGGHHGHSHDGDDHGHSHSSSDDHGHSHSHGGGSGGKHRTNGSSDGMITIPVKSFAPATPTARASGPIPDGPKLCRGLHTHDATASNRLARRRLILSCLLCGAFMFAELLGGYFANSLSIMTDAAHLLSDLAGMGISLIALWLASIAPTQKLSYGYHRAEVIGALVSVLLIWIMTIILLIEAVHRMEHPEDVDGRLMFIIAAVGLGVNIIMAIVLFQTGHGHAHGSLGGGGTECGGHGHSHGDSGADHGHSHSHGGGDKPKRRKKKDSLIENEHDPIAKSPMLAAHSPKSGTALTSSTASGVTTHAMGHGHTHGDGTVHYHSHSHGSDETVSTSSASPPKPPANSLASPTSALGSFRPSTGSGGLGIGAGMLMDTAFDTGSSDAFGSGGGGDDDCDDHSHSHGSGGGRGHSHGNSSKLPASTSTAAAAVAAVAQQQQQPPHGHSHGSSSSSSDDHHHTHSHGGDSDDDDDTLGSTAADGDLSPSNGHGHVASSSTDSDPHHHKNINVQAAFIHVLGDGIQSIGVMIAAAIIWAEPSARMADPLCTFLFSILVFFTTIKLARQCLSILMEATPEGVNTHEIETAIKRVDGVVGLRELHVWELTVGKPALSVHVITRTGVKSRNVLQKVHRLCLKQFKIHHTTIQIETETEQIECDTCRDLETLPLL